MQHSIHENTQKSLTRRLIQRGAAAVFGVATTMAMLPTAYAAAPNVKVTVRVKIDEVGFLSISERMPGQSKETAGFTTIASPLNQWVELQFSLPAGSTIYFAELDSYGVNFRDDELITIKADQTSYTVDLTLRQSGEPDNQGILG